MLLKIITKLSTKFQSSIYYLVMFPIYYCRFKKLGRKTRIKNPLKIQGYENIEIGSNVHVAQHTWLAALPHTHSKTCELIIGDGTNIGNFNHIYATNSIIIGRSVLTADKVYITDNLHSFENINVPIMNQPIKQISSVVIGDGSWLGENVCIIGAKIGRNCVIGANSVVTKDIPDYCVAFGAPAKIIKYYDLQLQQWVSK